MEDDFDDGKPFSEQHSDDDDEDQEETGTDGYVLTEMLPAVESPTRLETSAVSSAAGNSSIDQPEGDVLIRLIFPAVCLFSVIQVYKQYFKHVCVYPAGLMYSTSRVVIQVQPKMASINAIARTPTDHIRTPTTTSTTIHIAGRSGSSQQQKTPSTSAVPAKQKQVNTKDRTPLPGEKLFLL